jgi:hypothetical protein
VPGADQRRIGRRQQRVHRPLPAARHIRRTPADFGGNLAQGISIAIAGVACLLPCLFMISLVVWAIRKSWRRRRRAHISGK